VLPFSKDRARKATKPPVSNPDPVFPESSNTKGGTEIAISVHVGKVFVIQDMAFVTYVRNAQ